MMDWYVLGNNLCQYNRNIWLLRFVARTGETDYVDIVPGGGGCYAEGPYRTGAGRMEIGLQQDGCIVLKEWDSSNIIWAYWLFNVVSTSMVFEAVASLVLTRPCRECVDMFTWL